jgi:hypothetical protein
MNDQSQQVTKVLDRTGEEVDISATPDLYGAIQSLKAIGAVEQADAVQTAWLQCHAMHDAIIFFGKAKIVNPPAPKKLPAKKKAASKSKSK